MKVSLQCRHQLKHMPGHSPTVTVLMSSTGYEVTFSETTYAMFYETDMYVIDKR